MPRKSPSVVLVGRPNVGKSTLFNRMTGRRRAIVAPIAGTTRDSLARPVDLARHRRSSCSIRADCTARARIRCTNWSSQQGQRAIAGADLLVLLVDGREGLVSGRRDDRARAARDRPAGDAGDQQDRRQARARRRRWSSISSDSSRCCEISAEHGRASPICSTRSSKGSGPRARASATPGRSEARRRAGEPEPEPQPQQPIAETRVAIVGRPNVGKSSLVNRLLSEERVLVSDMPGTTRDAIDAPLTWHRRQFRIVDTAGHAAARPRRGRRRRWSW